MLLLHRAASGTDWAWDGKRGRGTPRVVEWQPSGRRAREGEPRDSEKRSVARKKVNELID